MEDDQVIRMNALTAATRIAAGKGHKYATIIKLADAYVVYVKTGVFDYEYAPPNELYPAKKISSNNNSAHVNARRDLEDRLSNR